MTEHLPHMSTERTAYELLDTSDIFSLGSMVELTIDLIAQTQGENMQQLWCATDEGRQLHIKCDRITEHNELNQRATVERVMDILIDHYEATEEIAGKCHVAFATRVTTDSHSEVLPPTEEYVLLYMRDSETAEAYVKDAPLLGAADADASPFRPMTKFDRAKLTAELRNINARCYSILNDA